MSANNYKKTTDNTDVALEAIHRVQYWNHHVAGAKTLITPTNGVQGEEGGRAAKRPVAGMTKANPSYAMGGMEEIQLFYMGETLVRGAAQQLATSYMQSLDADSPRTKDALELLADTQEEKDEITNLYENGWHISGNPNGGGRFVFQCARDANGDPIQFNSMAVKLEKNDTNSITDLFELRGSMWDGSEDYKAEYDLLADSPHSPGVVYTQRNAYPDAGPMELPKVLQRIWEMGSKEVVRTLVERGFMGLKNAAIVEKTEAPAKLAKVTAKAAKPKKSVKGDASSAEEVVREYCLSNNDQFVEILTGYGYVVHPDHAEGINADKARVVGDYIIVDGVFQTEKASDKTDYAVDVILPLNEEDPINYLRLMVRNSNDPLSMSRGTYGDQPANLFDAYVEYEHNGNYSAAVHAAAKEMGIDAATSVKNLLVTLREDKEARQKFLQAMPFTCLGYHHVLQNGLQTEVYVFEDRTGKELTMGEAKLHRKTAQEQLAHAHEWARAIGNPETVSWSFSDAYTLLRSGCIDAGYIRTERSKGLGVHFENGKYVLHQGTNLYCEGEVLPLRSASYTNSYERKESSSDALEKVEPFTEEELAEFRRIYGKVTCNTTYERAQLLGWAPSALLCGVVPFRAQTHLTAPTKTGKTALSKYTLTPLFGNMVFRAASSSPAGLMSALKNDSIPVIIEEQEADKGSSTFMREWGMFITQTAEDGGVVARSDSSQNSIQHQANFQFLSVAITVPELNGAADSRLTVTTLRAETEKANRRSDTELATIAALAPKFRKLVVDNAARYMKIRTVLKEAIEEVLSDSTGGEDSDVTKGLLNSYSRFADTNSTSIAGYYLIYGPEGIPTVQEAKEYVLGLGILESVEFEVEEADAKSISMRMMGIVVSSVVNGAEVKASIHQLFDTDNGFSEEVQQALVNEALELGIKKVKEGSGKYSGAIFVETNNANLSKSLGVGNARYAPMLERGSSFLGKDKARVRKGESPVRGIYIDPTK